MRQGTNEALIVIDAGTSALKALAFNTRGEIISLHRHGLKTDRPEPGRAEMDGRAVLQGLDKVVAAVSTDLKKGGHRPVAAGLSVQRSSFLIWSTHDSRPMTPVLTWQDTRANKILHKFTLDRARITRTTGIPLSPYSAGPKFAYLMEKHDDLSKAVAQGHGMLISLQTLLIHHLTGRLILDETIAGRTLLFDLHTRRWSTDLMTLFGVPETALPDICPSNHAYGICKFGDHEVPLEIAMGDQQAAMTGLGAESDGSLAINYGTSGSVSMNTGSTPLMVEGLLTNVAFSSPDRIEYLLEGTINAVGALFQWYAQEYDRPEITTQWPGMLAETANHIFIPGLNGLASPYWQSEIISSEVPTGNYTFAECLRAGMESIAFLTWDIFNQMRRSGHNVDDAAIHCGGGMAQPPLLQFLADLLQRPIQLHRMREATSRGVAIRLAFAMGWEGFGEKGGGTETTFECRISRADRDECLARWHEALTMQIPEILPR